MRGTTPFGPSDDDTPDQERYPANSATSDSMLAAPVGDPGGEFFPGIGEDDPPHPIVATFDDNRDGSSVVVNADFYDVYKGDGDTVVIQICDVMAFDNGDGDPITGASIEISAITASQLITDIDRVLGQIDSQERR